MSKKKQESKLNIIKMVAAMVIFSLIVLIVILVNGMSVENDEMDSCYVTCMDALDNVIEIEEIIHGVDNITDDKKSQYETILMDMWYRACDVNERNKCLISGVYGVAE